MASPEDAVRYARHWGEFAGWFGEPMSAEEASRWAAYRDGAEAKEIEKAKRAIVQGDWTRLDEAVQVLMPGWKFEKVEDGTYPLGGLEVPTKKVTVIGPTGERQVIDSTDFELGQANLETRIKLAEAKAKAEQAKAGETTQALTQANQELKARIDNRDLQQQWDNPQAPGTAAPTRNLTDLEKEAVKSYYDRLKEIDKLEASPEVKTRLREEIGREMAPALGRVMPWLAGQGGPSAEFQSLVNGDAEAAGGPAAGRESSVEERAMQARQAQDQARGARERAVQDDALRKRLRTMLMQREALRNDEAGRQQALEDLKRMDKLLPSDLAMIDSLYQMLSGTQPLTNPSPSSARLMFR